MTANPTIPSRHRPGKPKVEDSSSELDDDSEAETATPPKPSIAPPKVTSFATAKPAVVSEKVGSKDYSKDQSKDEPNADDISRLAVDEGFVTEESSSVDGNEEESDSGETSGSEESDSEEEAPRKLMRPTFIKKNSRKEAPQEATALAASTLEVQEGTKRKEKADAMIQEQLEKAALAKAAGKKDWDDDEIEEGAEVDDTDGLDPETERAAWKLRELKRVKREREAIEQAEKEREEIERRRNLSKEEREAEDEEFLDAQKEAREGKGKMSYMQKYFHKGAFFQDDEAAKILADRDIMGSRIADDVGNRELLPQFMQIRDMSKLGKKGRTKYKDLKTEDTGRWGQESRYGQGKDKMDERFLPDRERDRTGANATSLGTKRKPPEDAPTGPRQQDHRPGQKSDRSQDRSRSRDESTRQRVSQRSVSPNRRRRRSSSPPRRKRSPLSSEDDRTYRKKQKHAEPVR